MGAKIQLRHHEEQLFPITKVDKKIYGIFLGNVCTDPLKSKQMIENIQNTENNLSWSNLDGPATDIYKMQQFFYKNQIGGIQIHCSEQHIHTKVDILQQISGIFNQENDATIFYFSGHGSIQGLIIESKQKGIEYITFHDFYMLWKSRVSQQQLCFILLDCCHAGIWVQELKQINDFSVAILVSCSDIQNSKDLGQGRGGLFTWNLNKTLENKYENINLLVDESIYDQTPEFWGIHYKVYNIIGFPLFLTNKDQMKDFLGQKLIKKIQIKQNGTKYEGQCINDKKNGLGIMIYFDGRKYEGQFMNDLKHGKGIFTFNNGEKYEGDYRMGKRNGNGIIIYNNGSKYEGQYVDDMKHGKGIYTLPDGQTYIGQWVQNKLNGNGIKIEPNGFQYQGQFKNNKKHGNGILLYPDGRKYQGSFTDNKKNGQGILYYPQGRKQEGIWNNDILTQ